MRTDRMLALALAATAVASFVAAKGVLGEDAAAAIGEERTRLVFVSPTPDEAAFVGGLTGADLACREAAETHGLSGVFLAWLGDGLFGPVNRFDPDRGPLVNARGEQVAAGWRQLANGSTAPVLQLDGTAPAAAPWTNVAEDGGSGTISTACNRWWSASEGHTGAIGADPDVAPCDQPRPFVCVEQ